MRFRSTLLAGVVTALLAGLLTSAYARSRGVEVTGTFLPAGDGSAASGRPTASPSPPPSPNPRPPTLIARPVTVNATGFWSWALLDRRTGKISGSANAASTSTTESMIKAWLAADYLRLRAQTGAKPTQSRLAELSEMIRDSNDDDAQDIYQVDGGNATVRRLISTCGLTDTSVYPYWWSKTQMSPRDAVRMGQCLADGRAAGPQWTDWVLAEMRQVRGTIAQQPNGGRWGIIDALPAELAATVSIKNGWTQIWADGMWHVNCLAVHQDWVLAVMTRYPANRGLQYGANTCAGVTRQLLSSS